MNKVRLSARELLDLLPWLELNQPIQIVNAAKQNEAQRNEATVSVATKVVRHYVEAWESNDEINPLVLLYILQALRRTVAATDGDLGKELGIKRLKAGNPAGVSAKRRLTPTDKEEIPIEFERRFKQAGPCRRVRGKESSRDRVLRELKTEYRVSLRTLEDCLADHKQERDEAERVIKKHSKKKRSNTRQ